MNFRRSFHVLTFATALWSFLALVATGQLHVPAIAFFLFFFLLAAVRHRVGFNLPPLMWTLLSVVAFVAAIYGWFRIDRLYSVTYFFFFLEINKLMTARRNRDYFQIYGLTFFKMLAAAVSTQSIVFAPMLGVYVFLIIAAMMTFTIKRDAEQVFSLRRPRRGYSAAQPVRLVDYDADSLRRVADSRYWDPRMSAWVATLTIVVLVSGTLIFWIVPRTARSSFIPGLGGQHNAPRTSGYAEEINFGGIGEIQTDSTIVMRAIPDPEFLDSRPEFLRIRGTALDNFTGRQWTKARSVARGEVSTFQTTSVSFPAVGPNPQRPAQPFRARLTIEPENSGYFFTLDQPVRVDFGDPQQVEVDRDRTSIQSTRPRFTPISYEVSALIPEGGSLVLIDRDGGARAPIASPLARADDPLEILAFATAFFRETRQRHESLVDRDGPRVIAAHPGYLSIPDHPDMESVRSLAAEWTEGASSDAEKAQRIERVLREQFDYSLEAPFSNRDDHITQFLTAARAGHCEYFATAMALMLRAEGIPARVVNGYLTDEWSNTGRRYIVRQEHAHSWVEALLDGSSFWTTFDPTPASGIGSNRIGSSFYRVVSTWMDNMKSIWYERFVDYGVEDQRAGLIAALMALRQGRETTRGLMDGFAGWFSGEAGAPSPARRAFGVLLIGASLVLIVGVVVVLRMRRARAAIEDARQLADRFDPERVRPYLDLMEQLERVQPRPPGQTPRAFARAVAARYGATLEGLPALTEAYYRVRFDGDEWTAAMTRRAEELRMALADPRAHGENLPTAAGK